MGTDDGHKRGVGGSALAHFRLLLQRACRKAAGTRSTSPPCLLIFLLILISVLCFVRILPPPELMTPSDTFVRVKEEDYSSSGSSLPSQCVEIARELDRHYHRQQQSLEDWAPTFVFACHRKWCKSYWGHCEPCAGIGDRTRFLLSQVQDILEATSPTTRVQIDAPTTGLAILESAVYLDPSGWWGELFRYRSYDVRERKALPYSQLLLKKENVGAGSGTAADSATGTTFYYSHFLPNNFAIHDYNACYFHALFQPTPALRADLDRHNAAMDGNNNNNKPSIGIHYRTGDQSAFGLTNADNRLAGSALAGWNKMQQCARELAGQLFPEHNLEEITFYLATDNPQVKAHVRAATAGSTTTTTDDKAALPPPPLNIYLTDVQPGSYLRGNKGDRDAWMELYLLAARQGLVSNVLPESYAGTAHRLSQFAELAKKIGFMERHQVRECSLD